MKQETLVRAGAAGMVISGAALGYSYISHPHHMTPETIAAPFWVVIHALFALSLLLGLLGTTALYASTATRSGRLGLAGFLSLFTGMLLIFGLDYYEVLIAPYLAVHHPEIIAVYGAGDTMGPIAIFFPLAGMLTVVGYALLALGWMRARVLSRTVAFALIAAALAFGIGLSPLGGLLSARITAAAFGAMLVTVGFIAWRSAGSAFAARTV